MRNGIDNLYYITHIDNLRSISRLGILSHNLIIEKKSSSQKYTMIQSSASDRTSRLRTAKRSWILLMSIFKFEIQCSIEFYVKKVKGRSLLWLFHLGY
jgi:hypothetical protein